jgi:hypothetical protein
MFSSHFYFIFCVEKHFLTGQACRQLEVQLPVSGSSAPLWEAMGLAQHHDAVSGTEKQVH